MTQKANFDTKMYEMEKTLKESLSDEEILALVIAFGYTKEKLEGYLKMYEEIYELNQKQKKEIGVQYDSSTKIDDLREAAEKTYMKFVKISKYIFKDKESAFISLGLKGERKKTVTGFLSQGKVYYTAALKDDEILNVLISKGIKKADIEAGFAQLNALSTEYHFHDKEMEDKKILRQKRDEKFDTLVELMSEYKAFGMYALDGRQDLKNKLGW